MIAYYSLHCSKSFDCRIPKVSGKGYLKSCFGGHHCNQAFKKWRSPIGTGDICDIDGYLNISLSLNWWDDGFDVLIENIKVSLIQVFPRITEWQEIDFSELTNL